MASVMCWIPVSRKQVDWRYLLALLEVENLQTHFRTPDGVNRAVDGVSFVVNEGETLAIVGESGCGKSVTAMSLLRLIPEPPGKIAGSIRFMGKDLLKMSEKEMRAIRGDAISMIFQEPMTSLNPVLPIKRQLCETLRLHQKITQEQAMARASELMDLVGIAEGQRRYAESLSAYARQFLNRMIKPDVDEASHESSGGEDDGFGQEPLMNVSLYTFDPAVPDEKTVHHGLANV